MVIQTIKLPSYEQSEETGKCSLKTLIASIKQNFISYVKLCFYNVWKLLLKK